jgi:hypothetical protein
MPIMPVVYCFVSRLSFFDGYSYMKHRETHSVSELGLEALNGGEFLKDMED